MPTEAVAGFVVVCTHKALEITESGEVHRDTHDAEIHQELEYGLPQSLQSDYIYLPGGGIRVVSPSPLLSTAVHGQCMAVVKGTILNLEAVAAKYNGEQNNASPTQPNAAEVICKLFEQSGYSMVAALEGDFIFCLYDSKTERVLAARSTDKYALYEGRSEHNSLVIAGGTGQFFLPPGTHKMRVIHPGSFKWGWNAKPRKITSLHPNTSNLNSMFPADPAHKFHALSIDPDGKTPLGTEDGSREPRRARRGRGAGAAADRGKQQSGELQPIVEAVLETRDQDQANGDGAAAGDTQGGSASRRRRRRNNRNRQGASAEGGAAVDAAAPLLPDAAELPGAAALSDSPPPRSANRNRKPRPPRADPVAGDAAGTPADGAAADAAPAVEGTEGRRQDRQRRRKPRAPPPAADAPAAGAEGEAPAAAEGAASAAQQPAADTNGSRRNGRRRRVRRDGPKDGAAPAGAPVDASGEPVVAAANAQTAVTRAIQGLGASGGGSAAEGDAPAGQDGAAPAQRSASGRRRNNRQRRRGPRDEAGTAGAAAAPGTSDGAAGAAAPGAGPEGAGAPATAQDGAAPGGKAQRPRRRRRRTGAGKENTGGENAGGEDQGASQEQQQTGKPRRVWREKQRPEDGKDSAAPLGEANYAQPAAANGSAAEPHAGAEPTGKKAGGTSRGEARDAIVAALPAEV